MPPLPTYHASSAAHTFIHTHRNPSAQTTTITTTATQTTTSNPVLRLRAIGPLTPAPSEDRRRIQWAKDVIDNEGLGRKRSKVCCIYHAPHPIGESSSDSSSSSSEDSDSSPSDSDSDMADDGRARMAKGRRKRSGHSHEHGGGEDECGEEHNAEGGRGVDRKGKERVKRNAYETVPRVKPKTAEAKA